MKASARQLAEFLYQAVEKTPQKRRYVVERFFEILRRTRQKRLLPLVVRSLDEAERKFSGTTTITIETAFKISDDKINELLKTVQKKYQLQKLVPEVIIKPEIMGGFRIKFKDIIVDASTQSRLKTLARLL